jgi:hypothetical protein
MSIRLRILFMALMTLALSFGFLDLFLPRVKSYNFETLHIFLFNLCTGCAIIVYFSEKQKNVTPKTAAFIVLALAYALCAFFKIYLPAICIAFIMAFIVETIRIRRFSFFPVQFFQFRIPVSEKFHQASLLCLSIGLALSGLVMINAAYFPVIHLPKLQLNVFFLGFSFPVSLITLSVMFSLMKNNVARELRIVKEICFWTINMGVIVFFLFILFEMKIPQVIMSSLLTGAVIAAFYLFIKLGKPEQQKNFLLSGMTFLLATAVTGIAYIFFMFLPSYDSHEMKWLLKLHAYVSLYGWNLSGLAVIIRFESFPIRLNSSRVILLHWVTVILAAPLGNYFPVFSILAVLCYAVILFLFLFSRGNEKLLQTVAYEP